MNIPNLTRIKNFLLVGLPMRLVSAEWEDQLPGVKGRFYPNRWAYLFHQMLKRPTYAFLKMRHEHLHRWLRERLLELDMVKPGMSVLCLGARTGGEVLAFLDIGCFAVGLDIQPVPARRNFFVLYGDFHYLQFANNSVDIVYTNSLDHSLRLQNVLTEIKRVLKPGGLFILEAVVGGGKWKPSAYESCTWDSFDDLLKIITLDGFRLERQTEVCDYKEQAVFVK